MGGIGVRSEKDGQAGAPVVPALAWPVLRQTQAQIERAAQPAKNGNGEAGVLEVVSWLQRILLPTASSDPDHKPSPDARPIARLPNLHTLTLSKVPLNATLARALLTLEPSFARTAALAFNDCTALAFADFAAFVATFDGGPCGVRRVRVLGVQWLLGHGYGMGGGAGAGQGTSIGTGTAGPVSVLPPPKSLRKLEVSRKVDIPRLVNWLLLAHSPESSAATKTSADVVPSVSTSPKAGGGAKLELQELSCTIAGPQAARAVRDLLGAVGSSLEHLAFGFRDARNPTGACPLCILAERCRDER